MDKQRGYGQFLLEIQDGLRAYIDNSELTLEQIADEIGISRRTMFYLMRKESYNIKRQTLVKIRKFLWGKENGMDQV